MIRTRTFLLSLSLCGLLPAQQNSWHFRKDDPHTKRHVLTIDAKSFEATKDPNVLLLHNMAARIYRANGATFKEMNSDKAILNLSSRTVSYGPGLSRNIKL